MAATRKNHRVEKPGTDLTKAVAAIFAFAGFTMSTVSAFLSGAETQTALTNAIIAMLVCYVVGIVCGTVVARVIEEHNQDYEKSNPVPDVQVMMREEPIEIEPDPEEPANAPAGGGQPGKKL